MQYLKSLNDYQEYLFDIFLWLSYALLVASAFGLSRSAPKYLDILDYSVRTYVCLFLIWRFNPLRGHVPFTSLDKKIAFNAGLFILTTSVLNQYLESVKSEIKEKVDEKEVIYEVMYNAITA